MLGPVTSPPVKSAGASASGPSKITTLWATDGSSLSNSSVKGSSEGADSSSVEKPSAAAPSGAASVTTGPSAGSPPPSSSNGAATTARPPASIAMPVTAATIEKSVAPLTRRLDATYPPTATTAAAATRATTVAAVCETASSTRENPASTSPITASTATGIRIGSSRLCRFLPSRISLVLPSCASP